jgi:branched-chain amino acid transport system ATP-binding protein
VSPVFEAHNLWLRRPDGAAALADLTVFAHPGEVLALVGGHGAGKSLTLRTLAGLANPDAGSLRLNGEDLGKLGPHARAARGIAYIGDGGRVAAGLSVRDNLLLGTWRRRDRRAVRRDIAAWLERFPALAAAPGRQAADLGPEARTAAALGRAWAAGATVLLVDEPFAGLEGGARAGIAAALRAARNAGHIVVCAMHDADAAGFADRINVLANGRLVFSGSPGALAAAGPSIPLE